MFLTTPFIDQAFYTSDRRDLCRVNFEVNNLKPFSHLAFPHFATAENTAKQLGFDDELMATSPDCRQSDQRRAEPPGLSTITKRLHSTLDSPAVLALDPWS